tara:strand:- start:34 stop:651 length:618 start_codon:yes stop_codon:yes gene_type:complete
MDGGGLSQMGGNQLTFEALMTPNVLYFVITLAVIGYLYQTKMVLSRENSVKEKSSNLFDKQLYLEVGFMILIGLSLYVLNNSDNNTFVWMYMTIPILYLVIKSLMVFNKVTDFIKEAPGTVDVESDLSDLIKQQAHSKTNTQLPVTNQNSNHVDISNALNNALAKNSQYTNSLGIQQPQQPQQPSQMPQQFQMPPNNGPEGFSLF